MGSKKGPENTAYPAPRRPSPHASRPPSSPLLSDMPSASLPWLTGARTPLYLAPQAGVSESPFRRLCRRFGADVVVSEFVSAAGIVLGAPRAHGYLRFDD